MVPFAKKKRKGGSEEPPDEEEGDDFVDEMEGEDDDDEEEEDVDDDGMAGKFWLYLFVLFVGIFQYWAEGGRGGGLFGSLHLAYISFIIRSGILDVHMGMHSEY